MNVYLSARYARMDELKVHRADLIAAGFHCTSRWLDGGTFAATAENAMLDEADVAAADIVVGFMEEPVEFSTAPYASRGGRHYEIGFARGLGIPCIMVGDRPENVFHEPRQGMIVVPDWRTALTVLGWVEHHTAHQLVKPSGSSMAAAMIAARLAGRHVR